jgi:hypothetical protein
MVQKNVEESTKHQAGKSLRKVAKLVRGFFVQKCSRRISEIRSKENQEDGLERALDELKMLKAIDHVKAGDALFEAHFSDYQVDSKSSKDVLTAKALKVYQDFDPKICGQFLLHKKVVDTVKAWKEKLDSARSLQRQQAVQAKLKSKALKVNPRHGLGQKERNTAVFVNSLQEDEDREAEERLRRKEMKKQTVVKRGGPKRPGDTPKQDLSRYGPASQVLKNVSARTRRPGVYREELPQRYAQSVVEKASYSNATEEKLHPSWIAKQKQKAKLASIEINKNANYSSSKKIIFEE